jgi:hypothetical protein
VSDPIGMNGGGHPLDDLAAYALAALDDAERQAVDAHLAGCPSCQAELAGHLETLAALTPDEAPPAAVWQRVAAGIGAPGLPDPHLGGPPPSTPSAPGALGLNDVAPADPTDEAGPDIDLRRPDEARYDVDPGRHTPPGPPDERPYGVDPGRYMPPGPPDERPYGVDPGRSEPAGPPDDAGYQARHAGGAVPSLADAAHARARRQSSFRWLAAAACLAVALATGGIAGYAVGSSDGDSTDDIGGLAERASEQPDGVLATLANTSGQPVARVVADEDGAYMVLEDLQDLPEGQAYQLWSLDGPQPVSLGMMGRDGSNTVAFRLPPTITRLAISVEQTRGEAAPTGDFQAAGDITDPATSS